MNPDEEKEVFDYGDRTIFTLRAQSFDVDNEYGTIIGRPAPLLTVEAPLELPPVVEAPPVTEDPLKRLEQKLDSALHAIAQLQQKLESIDATLARALSR
jgi:hypothetical protein